MCVQTILASSGVFQIEQCSHCGGFSLHLGPVTLRMDLNAIRALREVLTQALSHTDEDAAREISMVASGDKHVN